MLFFRNKGKEEGEAAGRHCDSSNFISMLVFLFFFSFACLFSFSSSFQGKKLIWMEYRITLPVCLCLHLLYDHFCADREISQSRCCRLTQLSNDNKQLRCYNKMVSRVTVQRLVQPISYLWTRDSPQITKKKVTYIDT